MLLKRLRVAAKNIASTNRVKGAFYTWVTAHLAIRKNVLLLESHKGVEFIGSPFYMAKHLLASPLYSHLRFVIVCPKSAEPEIRALNKAGRTVQFRRPNSIRYCLDLATAGFLVNDTTFPPYFFRRDGQQYLNTWHGTPLKSLGRKTPVDMFKGLANIQRNFLQATHILAPNLHTERALLKDHMIDQVWCGQLIEGGYPRNDALMSADSTLMSIGDGKTHVAFMPTWRGTPSTVDEASIVLLGELSSLLSLLDAELPESVVLWVRLHPLVSKAIDLAGYSRIRAFPEAVDSYAWLARCDALLTDFSSVLFDFATTRRPVLLHIPDLEAYRAERGLCLEPDLLPFTRTASSAELIQQLSLLRPGQKQPGIDAFLCTYCPHDHGHSSEDLCAQFLLGQDRLAVRQLVPDKARKSVIIFAGSFLNNGITTSLKSLLSLIDHNRYNLFLCIDAGVGEARGSGYFRQLGDSIGFVVTRNWLAVTPFEAIGFLARDLLSGRWKTDDRLLKRIWQRECRRLFGSARFDALVHFTGYERRVTFLMMALPGRKIVFAHNDMHKEIAARRVSDPRATHLAYEQADVIASVRAGINDSYAREIKDISGKTLVVPNTLPLSCVDKSKAALPTAIHPDAPIECRERVVRAFDVPDQFRFVNLARFSREKGQRQLIVAFEEIWRGNHGCQLFILGPHGNLFDEVRLQAKSSPAADSIFVSQGSDNPFPILARADAFVLASHYEGLPMVLFESLALGIPIISTDIPGPAEFLRQGYGTVVDDSVQGLVLGMKAALAGELPSATYDFDSHNTHAVTQFYTTIDSCTSSVPTL